MDQEHVEFGLQEAEEKRKHGQVLYTERDYAGAVNYLNQGIRLGDCQASSYYYLGCSYAAMGADVEALEHLEKCIRLNGSEWLGCVACSEHHIKMKNYKEASRMAAEAGKRAQAAGDFASASNYWSVAGSIEVLHTVDHKTAAGHLISAMEAALVVEEVEVQLRLLADASPFLVDCIDTYKGSSSEHVYGPLETSSGHELNTVESNKIPEEGEDVLLNTLIVAEAHAHMGMALHALLNQKEKALRYFQAGAEMLKGHCEEVRARGVLFMLKYTLAEALLEDESVEEAAHLYTECGQHAPTPRLKLRCEVKLAHCVKRRGDFRKAAELLALLLDENQSLLSGASDMKAQLLFELGQSLLGVENNIEAVSNLEAAKRLWEETEDARCQRCYCLLFQAYIQLQRFTDAFLVAKQITGTLERSGTDGDDIWDLVYAVGFRVLADHESAREKLTACLDDGVHERGSLEECSILLNLGNAYRGLGDLDAALEKYEEAGEGFSALPFSEVALVQDALACVHLNRSVVYRDQALETEDENVSMDLYRSQLSEAKAAAALYQQAGQVPSELGMAYLSQAAALADLKDYRDAEKFLDKAKHLTCGNELATAKFLLVQSGLLECQGELEKAQLAAHKALSMLMEIQAKLKNLEHAWVTLLAGDMSKAFFRVQKLLIADNRYMDALMWAERSRMRLYFYLIQQRRAVRYGEEEEILHFDKDDLAARSCILEAVQGCPPDSLLVEYTCPASGEENVLYIYVVHRKQGQVSVDVQQVNLSKFFNIKLNKRLGRSLDALVKRTRTAIVKDTADARVGLGILYNLLIAPVEDFLANSSSLIFAPHEMLSLVPFSALYNGNQFLVERLAVGTVPSLRVLSLCFRRQQEFQRRENGNTAFVAGNPEPMGLDLPQLPGAEEEARKVATQLRVEAVTGADMTKSRVLNSLVNFDVVVLVTHGLLDRHFEQGALVMQAECGGVKNNRGVEVITAKEIELLEGAVRAGLVVFSACHAGEGRVTSEGLLGLGRSVLQVGAACVVVTLWKVDDAATPELVTGFFEGLLEGGLEVHHALRLAMLKMLGSGQPLRIWAPMVALGSPTLTLSSVKL